MDNTAGDYNEPSKIWKLSDTVSIVEAALLILEIEPQGLSDIVENQNDESKPKGYLAARTALVSAIRSERLEGNILNVVYENPNGGIEEDYQNIDYQTSFVETLSLANWLALRGYPCSTFPPFNDKPTGFRNLKHPRYSKKLAAAVEAWEAFDEDSKERGRAKQRLKKWLRLNAAPFGLTGEDGKPSESVIEEIAKIANWDTSAGAPKLSAEESDPD